MGGVYTWSLVESVGSVEVERQWSHNDAYLISVDPGRNLQVGIYPQNHEFVRENDQFTYKHTINEKYYQYASKEWFWRAFP